MLVRRAAVSRSIATDTLDCGNGGERLNIFNRDRFFRLLTDGGLGQPIDGWTRRFLAVQIFLCQRCPGQEILERFPIERDMGIHAAAALGWRLAGVRRFCACTEREVKIVLASRFDWYAE